MKHIMRESANLGNNPDNEKAMTVNCSVTLHRVRCKLIRYALLQMKG